jgi:hypothetical protein
VHQVPAVRIRGCNDAPVRPSRYVLYWMIASRRVTFNFALDRALEHCRELGKPLVIFEALRCGYRWASDRMHCFVIDGMADNAAACEKAGVRYFPYVEPSPGAGSGLLEALARDACIVVTDDFPCFFLPRMIAAAANPMGCCRCGRRARSFLRHIPSAVFFRKIYRRISRSSRTRRPSPIAICPPRPRLHQRWRRAGPRRTRVCCWANRFAGETADRSPNRTLRDPRRCRGGTPAHGEIYRREFRRLQKREAQPARTGCCERFVAIPSLRPRLGARNLS